MLSIIVSSRVILAKHLNHLCFCDGLRRDSTWFFIHIIQDTLWMYFAQLRQPVLGLTSSQLNFFLMAVGGNCFTTFNLISTSALTFLLEHLSEHCYWPSHYAISVLNGGIINTHRDPTSEGFSDNVEWKGRSI